jgi:hypothetical protein
MGYNQLIGPIPPELGSLVSLKKLYAVCVLTCGRLIDELRYRARALEGNALHGCIPSALGSLIQLQFLYVMSGA